MKVVKKALFIWSLILFPLENIGAQESTPTDAKPLTPEEQQLENKIKQLQADEAELVTRVRKKMLQLDQEQRDAFLTNLVKARTFLARRELFDLIETIAILEKIYPDHPDLINIKGSLYVEMRSFDKAVDAYRKNLKVNNPTDQLTRFNLAEIDFVSQNYEVALSVFEDLAPIFEKTNKTGLLRLTEFRILICKLKLGKKKEAEELAKKYDHWDDSPFYYYAQAALDYDKGNKTDAEKHIQEAMLVWNNAKILAPWDDTLMEAGYIERIFHSNIMVTPNK